MFAAAFWSCSGTAEGLSSTLHYAVLSSKIAYLAIVSVGPLWLLFALQYAGYIERLKRRALAALWVVPAVTLALILTNEMHGLVWPYVGPAGHIPGAPIIYEHGAAFWVEVVYSYLLMASGTILILRSALNRPRVYVRQAIVMSVAAFIPWLWNAAYIAGWSPIHGIDFTPVGFAAMGVLIALDITWLGFLDVVPLARRALFKRMSDGVMVFDWENRLVEFNPAAAKLMKFDESAMGKDLMSVCGRFPELGGQFEGVRSTQADAMVEVMDADRSWIEVHQSILRGSDNSYQGALLLLRDATQRKQSEELIRTSLREKEVLLKEVYHRVKNNLQIVASLLSIQASMSRDEAAKQMFRETEDRVRSMAQVHERLYGSDNLQGIDFEDYVKTIVNALIRSYASGRVHPAYDTERIVFPLETAIPCALIVNELVTNAIKHAFPRENSGVVTIGLRAAAGGLIRLVIGDNGVGFPASIHLASARSMGLTLVQTLSEQIGATVDVQTCPGTRFVLEFALPCTGDKEQQPASEPTACTP